MDALTYTQVRKDFAGTMNKVCDDHRPLIITRQNRSPVVMISLEDFNTIEETLYLVKNPNNAKRLLTSIEKAEKGLLKPVTLSEEEA